MCRTPITATRFLAPAALAIVALTAAAPAATAGGLAMITIDNPTDNPVFYQVKWGDGEWTRHRLSPGAFRNHYHSLDDLGRAPAPKLRFDYILNDGEVTYRTYNLGFYASYTTGYRQGKVYRFRTAGRGDILELKGL
jgi:hypothetical protein